MGEVAWPAEPTRGRKAWPSWALVQCVGIIAKYALGCCGVAPATRWSTQDHL